MKLDKITVVGLALVAGSAAVLTFTTLRTLALSCGFSEWLSWLLPLTVDAAGLVALRVWLRDALDFAKRLMMACIGLSVAGNATQHGLAAYELPVPWWVIVIVSAVPPSMLAAVVHLAHLAAVRSGASPEQLNPGPDHQGAAQTVAVDLDGPDRLVAVPDTVRIEPDTPVFANSSRPAEDHGPVWTEDDFAERADEDGVPDEHYADLVRWVQQDGVPSRNAVMSRYRVGTTRATRLLGYLDREPVAR